jgi:hypothetical protein
MMIGYLLFKQLAMPHFYSQPVIFTGKGLRQFSERLTDDISLGLHLRCLYLMHDNPLFYYNEPDHLTNIVSRAPHLTRFLGEGGYYTFNFSWEAFCCMAETAGASLLEFENIPISGGKEFCKTQPFRSLTALRSLTWNCLAKFTTLQCQGLEECFPRLVSLKISRCDPSFLKLISHIEYASP